MVMTTATKYAVIFAPIATVTVFIILYLIFTLNSTTYQPQCIDGETHFYDKARGVDVLSYCNLNQDFTTHSDINVTQVKYLRQGVFLQLYNAISALPDTDFATINGVSQKGTVIIMEKNAALQVDNDQFHNAVLTLRQLESVMDGYVGGNPSDDLITDSSAQKAILPIVQGIERTTIIAATTGNPVVTVYSSSTPVGPISPSGGGGTVTTISP